MSDDEVYALGNTPAEHRRLARQAAMLRPYTARLLADAGIRDGQRVMDLGSGFGDVAMLVAERVGPSGVVVGVERNADTIAAARSRVAAAGLDNVSLIQGDVGEVFDTEPFDAIVGRFILQFTTDPAASLHAAAQMLEPAGVIAFQEPTWPPFLSTIEHLSLATACASVITRTVEATGAKTDMRHELHRALRAAGVTTPHVRIEVPVTSSEAAATWLSDLFETVRPEIARRDVPTAALGDVDTLARRLAVEAASSPFGTCIGLVSMFGRTDRDT